MPPLARPACTGWPAAGRAPAWAGWAVGPDRAWRGGRRREGVFTPRRSSQPLTEVDPLELNTDRRSRARGAYECSKAQRDAAAEEDRRRDAERREEAEADQLRQLRQQMRVPARPVPASVYKASFDVQRSVKPREPPPPLCCLSGATLSARQTDGLLRCARGSDGAGVALAADGPAAAGRPRRLRRRSGREPAGPN